MARLPRATYALFVALLPATATVIGVIVLHQFFFSSRGRHTRSTRDWSSDVCSSDLGSDGTRPSTNSAMQAGSAVTATALRLPNRRHSHPVDGMETSEPTPGASSTRPSSAALAPSRSRVAGSRETHVPSRPPLTAKTSAVPNAARRSRWYVSCSVTVNAGSSLLGAAGLPERIAEGRSTTRSRLQAGLGLASVAAVTPTLRTGRPGFADTLLVEVLTSIPAAHVPFIAP